MIHSKQLYPPERATVLHLIMSIMPTVSWGDCQKPTFLNSNSIGNSRAMGLSVKDCCVSPLLNKVNLFIYLHVSEAGLCLNFTEQIHISSELVRYYCWCETKLSATCYQKYIECFWFNYNRPCLCSLRLNLLCGRWVCLKHEVARLLLLLLPDDQSNWCYGWESLWDTGVCKGFFIRLQ